ncbi:MAG: hypothetical protein M3Z41_09125 [Candidatus Eremiobacteraeota bacterium]|nr:hypothetical protein [Candidatus Eremiobacteraeota bacterium]
MGACLIVLVLSGAHQLWPKTFTHTGASVGTSPNPPNIILSAQPTPTPHCWIYDKIFPASRLAYKSEHVTRAEQRDVEKWAATVRSSERSLVRWMRLKYWPGGILVFVARPAHPTWWTALNTNAIIDVRDCDVHAYPVNQ